jgi:ribosomal protein L25 (general stress protein Ctc)
MRKITVLAVIIIILLFIEGCSNTSNQINEFNSKNSLEVVNETTQPASMAPLKEKENLKKDVPTPSPEPKPTNSANQATTSKDLDFYSDGVQTTPATINANLINYASAYEYNGSIYFSRNGIYKMDMDGQNEKRIFEQGGGFLNVADDWIYFTSDNSITKIRTDGSDKKIIYTKESEYPYMWLKVDGKFIYFNRNSELIKMDVDGNNVEVILTESVMDSINLVNDVIYYHDYTPQKESGSIWSLDITSRQKTCIKKDISGLFSILVNDGWLYYLERYASDDLSKRLCKISRISLQGGQIEEVYSIDQNIHSINIDKNNIFFVRGDTEYYEVISSISLDKKMPEKILPFNTTYRFDEDKFIKCSDEKSYDSPMDLNIAGKWIFYENVYGHNGYFQAINTK